MMKRLAITGITGKNGQVLYRHIAENEAAFLEKWSGMNLLVRSPLKFTAVCTAPTSVPTTTVVGDCNSRTALAALMAGCDTVLHIAGIRQSPLVLETAARCGVRRVILVHTAGIYSRYKAAGETYRVIDSQVTEMARANDIQLTILRPTMIFGTLNDHNIARFIRLVDQFKWVPVVNGARCELQPVHCTDLGKAFWQVLMNEKACGGQAYVLSGEKPITLRRILELIAEDMGVKRRFLYVPYWMAYSGACVLCAVTLGRKDFREKVQRLCEPRAYDHNRAEADFGYAPGDFEQQLNEEVQAYMSVKQRANSYRNR